MTDGVLVRHGWADWTLAEERGWTGALADLVPLSAAGVTRVDSVAQSLGKHRPGVVLTSPVTRAMQSAQMLAARLDLPLRVEIDLHEWLCDTEGKWSGREDFAHRLAEMIDHDGNPPAGARWEPMAAVRERVLAVLARHREHDVVLAVTHAVVIYAMTALEVPPGGAVVVRDGESAAVCERRLPSARELRLLSVAPSDPVMLPFAVDGPIDVVAVDRAITTLVNRHTPLRTRFRRRGGRVEAEVVPTGEAVCELTDRSRLREAAAAPLDRHGWPLIRAVAAQGPPAELVVSVDPLIADPGTLAAITTELPKLYLANNPDAAAFVVVPGVPAG